MVFRKVIHFILFSYFSLFWQLMKNLKIHGMVKVGTKGQIVIPKSARDVNAVVPGDELIVISKPWEWLVLFKVDTFEDVKSLVKTIDLEMKKTKRK